MKPGMTTLEWAVAYAAHGLDVFPCAANKVPLTPNGFLDATRDPGTIQVWWARWQCAEPALAVPGRIVVVDIDRKNRKDGFRDFERLDGRDPLSVETPIATTPSGGLHLYFMASKPYRNAVAIDGTGIDTRTTGGYVILPTGGNGRRWLRRLSTTPMRLSPGRRIQARQRPRFAALLHNLRQSGRRRSAKRVPSSRRRGEDNEGGGVVKTPVQDEQDEQDDGDGVGASRTSRTSCTADFTTPPPTVSSSEKSAKKRENARKPSGLSDLTAEERIAAVRESGGTLTLWPDGTGFDTDLRSVADAPLAGMLLEAASDNYAAILTALRSEAGLTLEQSEVRP
jgi:hypothetical protein